MIGAVQSKSDFEETLQKARTMLVFKIENQSYALSIEHVAQIIPMLRLTPVPQVDRMIEGVANIHGAVVPVISTRRYLGLPYLEPGLYTPIVLTRVGERLIGLIVDEVRDVITVPGQNVVSPKDILPEGIGSTPVMSGVVYQHDQSILLLEPRHLLRPTQVRTLNQAMVELRDSGFQGQEDGKTVEQIDFDSVRAALAEKRVSPANGNGKSHSNPVEQVTHFSPPTEAECGEAAVAIENTPPAASDALLVEASEAAGASEELSATAPVQPASETPDAKVNGKSRKKKRKNDQPRTEQAPTPNEGDLTA